MEQRIQDDHQLKHDSYTVRSIVDGQIVAQEVPALTAINMRLRDDYIRDASAELVGGTNSSPKPKLSLNWLCRMRPSIVK